MNNQTATTQNTTEDGRARFGIICDKSHVFPYGRTNRWQCVTCFAITSGSKDDIEHRPIEQVRKMWLQRLTTSWDKYLRDLPCSHPGNAEDQASYAGATDEELNLATQKGMVKARGIEGAKRVWKTLGWGRAHREWLLDEA